MKCLRFFLLLVFILVFSINQTEAKKLNIVATLPCLADIAEQIGGDHVKVYSITRGAQDPHYVDAKPSYMVKLHKADLLIYSGLELEIGWLPLLIQGARNNKVTVGAQGNLNASLAIDHDHILEKPRGEVDRSMGDVHPAGNPHYLLNLNNAIPVAEYIADRISQIDPDHMDEYTKNLEAYQEKIHNLLFELEPVIQRLRGKQLVCYHVHWSYLIAWLNIDMIGLIELRPGIPPTPKHKKHIIDLMKKKDVPVVVISSWKQPKKAREVAKAAGANLVVLPGEVDAMGKSDSYLSWISHLVNELDKAYGSEDEIVEKPKRKRTRERKRGL
jgi:zinc/manganese transport system substrate-binding protein